MSHFSAARVALPSGSSEKFQNRTKQKLRARERREGAGFVGGTLLSKDGDYGRLRPSLVIPLFLPFGTFPRFLLRTVTTKCFFQLNPAKSGEDTVSPPAALSCVNHFLAAKHPV